MKKTTPNPITAWSFSRWWQHQTCALQFKFKHIDKIPEEGKGPALIRGDFIHKGIERYLKKITRGLPRDEKTNYGPLEAFYKKLRARSPLVELELAFDVEWREVPWFDKSVWFRAKIDAAINEHPDIVEIFDHKSGREKPGEHALQLETYAIIAPTRWRAAGEIQASMLYVDQGKPVLSVFHYVEIDRLRKRWQKRVAPMFKDKTFKPTPGFHCKWCVYSKHKKGPCHAG